MVQARLAATASDYMSALRVSSDGKLSRVVPALFKIGWARTRYKLGPRPYSLFRLWTKSTAEWKDYLDDSPLKPLLRTLSEPQARRLITDKIAFHAECVRRQLPTVPIVAAFRSPEAAARYPEIPEVTDAAALQALLDVHRNGLFCKPYDGTHGIGAFAISGNATGLHFGQAAGSAQDAFAYCRRCAAEGVLLVQPRLTNATSLRQLMFDGGFGTVRAVTYLDEDQPRMLAACLRLITAGNAADNFGHGSTGNLIAPINSESGRLTALRASRSTAWPLIYDSDRHPTTSYPVTGFQVPFWRESVELALRAQKSFQGLHSVGWDIGITEGGPVLIEGNCQYDFDLLQVAFDRGFRPALGKVLDSHRKRTSLAANP